MFRFTQIVAQVAGFIILVIGTVIFGSILLLSTAILDLMAPFLALATTTIISFFYWKVWKSKKWLSFTIIVSLGCGLLLVPGLNLFQTLEAGMDDGPFYGEPYVGDNSFLIADERIPYGTGEICVFNRTAKEEPVMFFRNDMNNVEWAIVMCVSSNEKFERGEIREIADLEIHYGFIRDIVYFNADWTFGLERGYAYLWKYGGLQRFYLSW